MKCQIKANLEYTIRMDIIFNIKMGFIKGLWLLRPMLGPYNQPNMGFVFKVKSCIFLILMKGSFHYNAQNNKFESV